LFKIIKKVKVVLSITTSTLIFFNVAGCSILKSNAFKGELSVFGTGALMDRDSFERIDLTLLLDPTSEGIKEDTKIFSNDDDLPTKRKKIENAFDAFYKNPVGQIRRRNRVQERILAASNQRCGEYKKFLKQFDSGTNFFLGSLTTAVAGAGAIFSATSTVRALSGAAAIISGVRSEFNQVYFSSQAIQVLSAGFDSKRKELYENMLKNRPNNMTKYPVEAAVKDAVEYHENCSLLAGLERAALSIERIDNPGLKGAQNALIQAKKLQYIMETPPEEISMINLSDPFGIDSVGLVSTDLFSGGLLSHGLPLKAYASFRGKVALFVEEYEHLAKGLKEDAFKDNKAALDPIGALVKSSKTQTWKVLETQTKNEVNLRTSSIQNTMAKVTETLDKNDKEVLKSELRKEFWEGRKTIIKIEEIYETAQVGYKAAMAALQDAKETNLDERIKNATKRMNQIIASMLQKRSENGVIIVQSEYVGLSTTDKTSLRTSLSTPAGKTIANQQDIEDLLTDFNTNFNGFEGKDPDIQKPIIVKATSIIDIISKALGGKV